MTVNLELTHFFRNSIRNKYEIYIAVECNKHFSFVFRKCFNESVNAIIKEERPISNYEMLRLEIDSVVDFLHDEINTGHWSDVLLATRRAFTAASFIKALIIVTGNSSCNKSSLESALKALDIGLLLGAPLVDNSDLLRDCASFISQKIAALSAPLCIVTGSSVCRKGSKRKLSTSDSSSSYANLSAHEVDTSNGPSLQYFDAKYFKMQLPVKLAGCMTHWPAMTKWQDLNYFLELAGDRTVPIEIGSHYTDEDWSQKLITLKEFIRDYFMNKGDRTGYLAQHNLFDQIAELKKDIHVPEYCCLSENNEDYCEPDINAWFGPEGTVSPLHYDPKNNLLAQVFGKKQIILFSPEDSGLLYPYSNHMLSNTSQVNPVELDFDKFPLSKEAKMFKCLLEPGEILFIPQKWWHHVTALEKSFSVSFWWK